jgi:dTDP-4-amino-4,6-dideoxygalactose transaminase
MRNFGFVDEDEVVGLGTNAKLSEAAAAMGLASLEGLDGFLAANRRNYAAYAEALAGIPGVSLLPFEDPDAVNCHHVAIEVDAEAAGIDRDQLRALLSAENVLARRYFYPGCHRTAPYGDGRPSAALPATERALARTLSLPTGTAVTPADVAAVGAIVRTGVAEAAVVRRRLEG